MTVFTRTWKQNGQEKGQIFYTDWNDKDRSYDIKGQVDFDSWQETMENERTVRMYLANFGFNPSVTPDWYLFKAPRTPRKGVSDMFLVHTSCKDITYDEWFAKVNEMMN